jgi:HlyD family secretion protein
MILQTAFRRLGTLALIGGLIAILHPTAACAAPATQLAASDDSAPTTVVHRGTLDLALDFKGVFEPVDAYQLRLKVRGYHDDFIIRRAAPPGATVAKGDSLLELDTDKIDVQIAAAENQLNIAQANLTKAAADIQLGKESDDLALMDAKSQLVDAQTELKRWDTIDGAIMLLSSGMNVRINDYYLESSADELDQLRKMYKSEDLTSETADIVIKRAVRVLDIYKTMSQISHSVSDRYAQFEAGIQREQLSTTASQHSQTLEELYATQAQARQIRQADLVTAQAAADEAQKNLDDLKRDREQFSTSSPIDGVLVYGNFDDKAWHETEPDHFAQGEKVQADQVLMTVFRPGRLRVAVECPENRISFFTAGAKVQVASEAIPDLVYDGICRHPPVVGESQGSQQIFDLIADLPAVDERISPGFTATVNFNAGSRDNVLLVPVTAVWRGKVWVRQPGSAAEKVRSVVVGPSDGRNIEIVSGLSEGDTILTRAYRPSDQ